MFTSSGDLPRTTPPGAIVIGDGTQALGVVRSLGRRGIPVYIAGSARATPRFSRYARRAPVWHDDAAEAHQLEYLFNLLVRYKLDGWALIPTVDEVAAVISRNRQTLMRRFTITVPSWDVLQRAYDKRLAYELAAQLGVDHPWTVCPRGRSDVVALDCVYPVILKPAHKEQVNRLTYFKAWKVTDRHELLARYDEAAAVVPPDQIMVQEYIPGGAGTHYAYGALCLDGRVIASATARGDRLYPMEFSRYSTHSETIELPAIEEAGRRFFAALRYTGLIEIDFKHDRRSGSYKLLDVNVRAWGWSPLARRAGVDFPYLLWRLICGDTPPEARARPGVRWVRLSRDLPLAALEIWRGNLTTASYLRSLRAPIEFAIFAPDDPVPALMAPFSLRPALFQRVRRPSATGNGS
jgi:predicted ATP-grasp superfamily ATP-dependent carboligase